MHSILENSITEARYPPCDLIESFYFSVQFFVRYSVCLSLTSGATCTLVHDDTGESSWSLGEGSFGTPEQFHQLPNLCLNEVLDSNFIIFAAAASHGCQVGHIYGQIFPGRSVLYSSTFSKYGHFLSLRHFFMTKRVGDLFMQELVRLYGILSSIVSDHNPDIS